MKVLSLTQPWAEAMALRIKRFETRGWSTRYTGPLAIHATKERWDPRRYDPAWVRMLADNGIHFEDLQYGAVICVGQLIRCYPTGSGIANNIGALERSLGDYSEGRHAWHLVDVRVLKNPILMRGYQFLFDWPKEIPQPTGDDFIEVAA
jgi:hypothetical protein